MKKMIIPLIVFVVLFLIWVAYGFFSIWQIEMPSYQVTQKERAFEIRDYDAFVIAETTVKAEDYWSGVNRGFSVVGDYIFGNNTSNDKIAMTTPVISESDSEVQAEDVSEKIAMTTPVVSESDGEDLKLYFVMPGQYTLQSLPRPNDDRVRLQEVRDETRLVLRFSWWVTQERLDRKIESFKAYAKENNLTIGPIQVAQYNPPGTPPFMRRNEIWATVE